MSSYTQLKNIHFTSEPLVGNSLLFKGFPSGITITSLENGTVYSVEDMNPYNVTSPGIDITGAGVEIDFGDNEFFFRMFNVPRHEYGFNDPLNITMSIAHRDYAGMGNFGGKKSTTDAPH